MKRLVIVILALTALTAGCSKDIIQTMGIGDHQGVIQDYKDHEPIPAGFAELMIVSSLKTPEPGYFAFGSKIRGTPDYLLLISIDGHKIFVHGDLKTENSAPKGLNDAEAGEGIRYLFTKDLLVKAGRHKVIVSLPEDNVASEKEVFIQEGTGNSLRIDPIYGQSDQEGIPGQGLFSSSSFMNGITGFWFFLNDREI